MIGCSTCEDYAAALEKAKNPNMTTANNPLAKGNDYERKVMEVNMTRLENDARRRTGIHGNVYAAIMDTRMKGD